MRLWSVHPRYLDRQGLTACWREGLLAQKVLTGTTRGYRNHPQLRRFRADTGPVLVPGDGTPGAGTPGPGAPGEPATDGPPTAPSATPSPQYPGDAIVTYLHAVVDEAGARGYTFDRSKVLGPPDRTMRLEVSDGQLLHEWGHLRAKLALRSPAVHRLWHTVEVPAPHPLFVVVPGPVADWEVLTDAAEADG